jgi:hypothetical protein
MSLAAIEILDSVAMQRSHISGDNWRAMPDGELDKAVRTSISEIRMLSRRAQTEARERLLPALQEVKRRYAAGETINGIVGLQAYFESIYVNPATVRSWEFRFRQELHQLGVYSGICPEGNTIEGEIVEANGPTLKMWTPAGERRKNRDGPVGDFDEEIRKLALTALTVGFDTLRKKKRISRSHLASAKMWSQSKLQYEESAKQASETGLQYVMLPRWKALQVVIERHYLHRVAPITWAFGIEVDGEILGVLTVGKLCSSTACAGVCGKNRSKDCFELNRLWLSDSLPHNSESQFIAFCLRQLKRLHPSIILLSYADSAAKNPKGEAHVGYIYQAVNFLYCGTSTPWTDKVGGKEIRRSPKHRYVWLSRRADRRLLRWPVLPYPKISADVIASASLRREIGVQ